MPFLSPHCHSARDGTMGFGVIYVAPSQESLSPSTATKQHSAPHPAPSLSRVQEGNLNIISHVGGIVPEREGLAENQITPSHVPLP